MTSKERVEVLLKKEVPDRIGLYEHFWGETLRDCWPEQGYPKGENPGRFFDSIDARLICFTGEQINRWLK